MPSSTTPLAFHACDRFTLGVEEELLMASPSSLRPFGGTDAVLERVDPAIGTISGEISDGVLELITPVCEDAGQAVDILAGLRREAGRHVTLLGAGVHPLARFGDVRLRGGARYDQIGDTMRAVMRQTPHCGVHVHVGMPDAEGAVRACNGKSCWISVPQALGATAPNWYGRAPGIASASSVNYGSSPRAESPRLFAGSTAFAVTVEQLRML